MSSYSHPQIAMPFSTSNLYHHCESPYIDGMTMPIPGWDNQVYPMGDDQKGKFIYFEYGQWRRKIIRAELHELQHADMGRKYAEVDRRSLDPPPVVALRLYERIQIGHYRYQDTEITNYEDIESIGLLCSAELIPVTESSSGQLHSTCNSTSYEHDHHMSGNSEYDSSFTQQHVHVPVPESEVARLTSKVLIGSKVVQPHPIDLGSGRKNLLFVFPDLAVRNLGTFRLRYKFFDLFSSPPGSRHTNIQAECIGGSFRIFSTKHFPGLQISTDLTKVCLRQRELASLSHLSPCIRISESRRTEWH
ncbi:velvet factor-domain-containing protein [Lentinula raphanica]|nr:velvet factor-domain-containing protein [Lentinula raphanica]